MVYDVSRQSLMEDFCNGDEKAFGILLQEHLTSIHNFIYQLTHDRAVSEDLTQETFIKVWKHRARFDTKKSFKTWIFSIAKNTALDYFKKKKTISFSFFEDEAGGGLSQAIDEETILPDELYETKERIVALETALEKIPPLYRGLLVLVYREDFSLGEVARILDEPYNTIKSRHQRALKLLKQATFDMDASKNEGESY